MEEKKSKPYYVKLFATNNFCFFFYIFKGLLLNDEVDEEINMQIKKTKNQSKDDENKKTIRKKTDKRKIFLKLTMV